MKVGSLCEYIGDEFVIKGFYPYSDIVSPKREIRSTVKSIFEGLGNGDGIIVTVEEFVMGVHLPTGHELGSSINNFRELLPPEEIAEALEEVNEVLKEQEVLV